MSIWERVCALSAPQVYGLVVLASGILIWAAWQQGFESEIGQYLIGGAVGLHIVTLTIIGGLQMGGS